MTVIGVYDAKTQLPKLLDRVSRGERFLITKRGRPVAQLVPTVMDSSPDLNQIVQEMQDWQEREGPLLGASPDGSTTARARRLDVLTANVNSAH